MSTDLPTREQVDYLVTGYAELCHDDGALWARHAHHVDPPLEVQLAFVVSDDQRRAAYRQLLAVVDQLLDAAWPGAPA